jgi:hypothetical protein
MAWEYHGGRRYYYKKRRKGGRVISEYMGAGELAGVIALIDADEQARLKEERERWHQERQAQRAIDQEIDALGGYVKAVAEAVLLAAGCYQHKGEWRRKLER